MKTAIIALKLFLALSITTGIIYPLAVWGYAQVFFASKAGGGLIMRGGRPLGAELIGQKFTRQEYFWARPSAADYNPLPSGGSNLSPTSRQLLANVKAQQAKFGDGVTPDLLFSSGSGLDPHISPEAARIQCARVAGARGIPEVDIISLVSALTESRQFGFLGEPRVNVLRLNMKLDEKYGQRLPTRP